MNHTFRLRGKVPCKKNRWHRAHRGAVYFDEPKQMRGNIQSLLDALQLQVQAQWGGKPPIERVKWIKAYFYVADGASDLDGKYTTLQDILVRSGVLRNDSIKRVPRFMVEAFIVDSDESVAVRLEV